MPLQPVARFCSIFHNLSRGVFSMASRSVARSESIAAFIPALELLVAEAMNEWKVPGPAIAVVQNGEVALLRAYGLRDVEAVCR
jgi:CubicO group peptidase (beta-lactamase class C family)